eukprot:6009153-Amphidinium_carterae.1
MQSERTSLATPAAIVMAHGTIVEFSCNTAAGANQTNGWFHDISSCRPSSMLCRPAFLGHQQRRRRLCHYARMHAHALNHLSLCTNARTCSASMIERCYLLSRDVTARYANCTWRSDFDNP